LPNGLGHHQSHRIADVFDFPSAQALMLTVKHGAAIGALARQGHLHGAQAIGRHILAGVDGQHARRLQSGLGVDGLDAGVRVGRTHQHGVGLPRQVVVVHKLSLTAQQSGVFETGHGLAYAELGHADHSII